MQEPLFMVPVFQTKIWGGRRLATDFNYELPQGSIGECWAISGHSHGLSTIANGPYAGQTLADLYQQKPELFGHPTSTTFPLLTKILDAEASLSVQVHPDDDYALSHEHELGKTECWYIISAEPGAYLIYGHHAQTAAEFQQEVEQGDWQHLLRRQPVKAGDFVYVPSGTVHALNKGIVALETQQSSDTTYRLYDYDRVDAAGNKRLLHIKQALAVTTIPFQTPQITPRLNYQGASTITTFITPPQSPYFSVYKWEVEDHLIIERQPQSAPYTLVSVISGTGQLVIGEKRYPLTKGQHFILPEGIMGWTLTGQMTLISSEPATHI